MILIRLPAPQLGRTWGGAWGLFRLHEGAPGLLKKQVNHRGRIYATFGFKPKVTQILPAYLKAFCVFALGPGTPVWCALFVGWGVERYRRLVNSYMITTVGTFVEIFVAFPVHISSFMFSFTYIFICIFLLIYVHICLFISLYVYSYMFIYRYT